MKDSGIEWVGECPEHWEFVRGRYLFKQRNTKGNLKNLELLSPSQKFGVVPQTLLEELTTQTVVKVKEDTNLETFKTIHVGDFCISLRSFQGGFEYSKYEGVVSSAYKVFYPIVPIYDGYYKFLFKDKSFIEKMNSYTISFRDGKNIAFEDFGNTYIPYPQIDEQRKIAEFLDKKCKEVDGLIADIQTQIDTLEQYKRSTITEAVTKGLNPTAEMKDSNIQWVGKIPAHWGSLPIYVLFEEVTKKNIFGKEKQALQFRYGTIVPKENFEADDDLYVAKTILNYNIVEPGVIMLNGLNLNFDFVTQRVALVRDKGIITSAYMAIKSKNFNAMNPEYSTYLLKSYDICKAFHNMGGGVRKILNFEELKRNYIIVPPIDEQKSIAEYLDKKCAEIDACIEEKKQQISVLETYKKSIIFEYVTGKKEVV